MPPTEKYPPFCQRCLNRYKPVSTCCFCTRPHDPSRYEYDPCWGENMESECRKLEKLGESLVEGFNEGLNGTKDYTETHKIKIDVKKSFDEYNKKKEKEPLTYKKRIELIINGKMYNAEQVQISDIPNGPTLVRVEGVRHNEGGSIVSAETVRELSNNIHNAILNKHFAIKNVLFNPPATIIFWEDGTKTVVKCENEVFDPEKGLAMAITKKALGNKYEYFNTVKRWTKKFHKQYTVYTKTPIEKDDVLEPCEKSPRDLIDPKDEV